MVFSQVFLCDPFFCGFFLFCDGLPLPEANASGRKLSARRVILETLQGKAIGRASAHRLIFLDKGRTWIA